MNGAWTFTAPRAHPAVHRVVRYRQEVGERRVVHQHVHRAVERPRLLHEPFALVGLRDVHRDRRRLVPRVADARDGVLQRAFQRMVALVERARRAHHASALRREHPRDLRPDAPARPGHDHRPSVQLAHVQLLQRNRCIVTLTAILVIPASRREGTRASLRLPTLTFGPSPMLERLGVGR